MNIENSNQNEFKVRPAASFKHDFNLVFETILHFEEVTDPASLIDCVNMYTVEEKEKMGLCWTNGSNYNNLLSSIGRHFGTP